jgi:hypothetical protein
VVVSRFAHQVPFAGFTMRSQFTLEYWQDGRFYVGRLLEVPGVFS